MPGIVRLDCSHCGKPLKGVEGTTLLCPMCKTGNLMRPTPPPQPAAAPAAKPDVPTFTKLAPGTIVAKGRAK